MFISYSHLCMKAPQPWCSGLSHPLGVSCYLGIGSPHGYLHPGPLKNISLVAVT